MKITRRQLRNIIRESYEEDLEAFSDEYSDTYKSIYGIRPRWIRFSTVDEAEEALSRLYDEMSRHTDHERYRDELDAVSADIDNQVQSNQPGPYDSEDLSKHSGMGRRVESRIQMKNSIRKIIKEVLFR